MDIRALGSTGTILMMAAGSCQLARFSFLQGREGG